MVLSTFVKTKLLLEEFAKDERGVTAIEYGVIGAAIAGVALLAFTGTDSIGVSLEAMLTKLKTSMATAAK